MLISCLVATTKYMTEAIQEGKVGFELLFLDSGNHDREVIAGAWGIWSHSTCVKEQKAMHAGTLPPFTFFFIQSGSQDESFLLH